MNDITYIGMALIDSIIRGFDPEPVSASGFRAASNTLSAGGEAVNGSIAAAKLGLHAGILTSLGNDTAGDMIIHALESNGVDTSLILRSGDHPTPVTTMFVNDDGSRRSVTNAAHRYQYHPDNFTDSYADSRIIVLGSLFRGPFDIPDIVSGLITSVKEKSPDTLIFADTKLPNFRKLTLQDYSDSLPMIDYLFPNEDEAKFCSGRDDPDEMADVLLDAGVRNVVIKLGADGCLLKNRSSRIRIPGYRIDAVDATGAGDNFIAGFASELLRGSSQETALRFANACGAVCTTAVGASAAMKNREQILDFLAVHG